MNMQSCELRNCKYCVKDQCTSEKENRICDYADMMRKKEIMYEVLTKQGAESVLANDQKFKEWLERGIACVRRLDELELARQESGI